MDDRLLGLGEEDAGRLLIRDKHRFCRPMAVSLGQESAASTQWRSTDVLDAGVSGRRCRNET